MAEHPVEEKIALAGDVEAALTEGMLAIVGADLVELPADLSEYAEGITKLDFSFNCLT